MTDILQGSILGQNALALLISSAFIFNVKKSFYVSNLTTQQVYVFFASLIYLIALILTHLAIQGFDFSWLSNTFTYNWCNYMAPCTSIFGKTETLNSQLVWIKLPIRKEKERYSDQESLLHLFSWLLVAFLLLIYRLFNSANH